MTTFIAAFILGGLIGFWTCMYLLYRGILKMERKP